MAPTNKLVILGALSTLLQCEVSAGMAFQGPQIYPQSFGSTTRGILKQRGGSLSVAGEYDSDVDENEYDLDEDEQEDEKLAKLSTSAVKSIEKKTKKKVSQAMSKKATRRRRRSILEVLRMPYILRAFLNPFTMIAMTRCYFASLFNINYLKEVRV